MDSKELAKALESGAKWLWENKCGCCHWNSITDDSGKRWSIVLGWNEGFGTENSNDYFVDAGMAIAYKIGYETPNNALQCDFDWDFLMPYNEETGEVDDTCSPLARNENYEQLARFLLEEFDRVVSEWGMFETNELKSETKEHIA